MAEEPRRWPRPRSRRRGRAEAAVRARGRGSCRAGGRGRCRARGRGSSEPEAGARAGGACQEAALAASTCRARRAARARRSCARSRRRASRSRAPASRSRELGRRQERRGVVVSDKGDKTIVVKVDVIKSHPKYKKVVRSTVKFHAHDEANTAGVGDTVRIVETRPAVEAEALAARRDRGEGEDDPAGNTPQGRRQHGCS